jgi:integrase
MTLELPVNDAALGASTHATPTATTPDTSGPAPSKKMILRIPKKQVKPTTLSALKARIVNHPALTEQQRRDMASAINGLAKAAGLPLTQIPTDVAHLRRILREAHPVRLGISRKRFGNMKALLVGAMRLVGLVETPPKAKAHSADWKAFLHLAMVRQQAWGISRFAAFCSSREMGPSDVTNATLREYEKWLGTFLIEGDPAKAARTAGNNFNAIVRRGGLDRPLLDLRRGDRYLARPLDTYLPSFQADLERYIERLRKPDLFSEDGPTQPLKEMSLRNIRAHVRQLADAAVTAGYSQNSFISLKEVVQVPVLRAAAEVIQARTAKEFSGTLHNILSTARNIAFHYVKLPAKDLEQIDKAKAVVAKGSGYNDPHLTEKNQGRLAQFVDGQNYKNLVLLPNKLMAQANKAKGSPRSALDALVAVAITILLACPMRAKNLASLDIQKHLIAHKKGKKIFYGIHVPKTEVKNRQDIDADFSEPMTILIRDYLAYHHPVLAAETTAFFPRPDGRPRDPGKLGELVEERIHKWLGLNVNMHFFRHLAAMQYLEAFPGQYESVRRFLGHAKIDTTTGYYAPLSTKAIRDNYHKEVLEKALKAAPVMGKGKGKS